MEHGLTLRNVRSQGDSVANVFLSHRSQIFRAIGAAIEYLMWGTASFCDELTGDFGGAFEAISMDGCRLFCRLAEILSHGVLGLLQHYRHETDLLQRPLHVRS